MGRPGSALALRAMRTIMRTPLSGWCEFAPQDSRISAVAAALLRGRSRVVAVRTHAAQVGSDEHQRGDFLRRRAGVRRSDMVDHFAEPIALPAEACTDRLL